MEQVIERVVVVLYRRPGKRWILEGAYSSLSQAQKSIDEHKELDAEVHCELGYSMLEGPLITYPESMAE